MKRLLIVLGLCLAISAQAQTITTNPPSLPTISGDCTNSGNALTCTKTNSAAFAASATTDTTNATNISAGVLGSARGGAGSVSGALKANGSGAVSGAACADLSNAAASCSTDATNASNLSAGTMASARLPSGLSQVLGSLRGANMNTTADQAIAIRSAITKFTVSGIMVTNCTGSLTLAVGGFYPTTAKGGTALVANTQAYSALSGTSILLPTTLVATTLTTAYTVSNIYLSLTTAAGSAATCDSYILGTDLT
jgi:hypothetical protein